MELYSTPLYAFSDNFNLKYPSSPRIYKSYFRTSFISCTYLYLTGFSKLQSIAFVPERHRVADKSFPALFLDAKPIQGSSTLWSRFVDTTSCIPIDYLSRRTRLWVSIDRWVSVAACENDHNPTLYRNTWLVVQRAGLRRRLKWCYYMGQRRKNASHVHISAELRLSEDIGNKTLLPRTTLSFCTWKYNLHYDVTYLKEP
jgi:hypothetical protein